MYHLLSRAVLKFCDVWARLFRAESCQCHAICRRSVLLEFAKANNQFENGHYNMPLPFRNGPPILPDNRAMALLRLSSLRRKLLGNETYLLHYEAFMSNLIQNGHAERIPDCEAQKTDGHMPHHGVYHPKKPGKFSTAVQYMMEKVWTSTYCKDLTWRTRLLVYCATLGWSQ